MAKQPQNQTQATETNIPKMAGDAMGASIKQILLQEIKLLPKPWAAMSSGEQNDAIFRIERGGCPLYWQAKRRANAQPVV